MVVETIAPDCILPHLKVGSKKQLLQELARKAAEITGHGEAEIYAVLLDRERLGTTGIGNGIAIPHGKLPTLDRVYSIFARLDRPIAFEAIDEAPVDLVFMLLAPCDAGPDHLKALARVARMLRDGRLCEKVRGSSNADAICAIINAGESSQAA